MVNVNNLPGIIATQFPTAIDEVDFLIAAPGDGSGSRIAKWNVLKLGPITNVWANAVQGVHYTTRSAPGGVTLFDWIPAQLANLTPTAATTSAESTYISDPNRTAVVKDDQVFQAFKARCVASGNSPLTAILYALRGLIAHDAAPTPTEAKVLTAINQAIADVP